MKRIAVILIMIAFLLGFAYALNQEFIERVWAFNGTQATTIDLSKTFYLPTYGVTWEEKSNDLVNGTYLTQGVGANGIAHIGVATCTHSITFTVSTTGRFVSQSDPTKYRDFYVALKPRIREYTSWAAGGTDHNYLVDLYNGRIASSSDRVPNTRGNNSVSVRTPVMPSFLNAAGNGVDLSDLSKRLQVDGSTYVFATRVYYDVLLCLEPITSQDMVHLARLDDYVAEINVTWQCNDPTCSGETAGIHNGQYTFVIRGYYGDANNQADNVFLLVTPEAVASRIDIMGMIDNSNHSGKEQIATMKVITTTPTSSNDWNNLVKVFISSSVDYNNPGTPFALTRYYSKSGSNEPKSIPFTVRVYNEGYQNTNNYNREYDGTDYWISPSESSGMCLDFTGNMLIDNNLGGYDTVNVISRFRERAGNNSVGMVYNGVVMIEIEDEDGYIASHKNEYSGLYMEDIYFHIVYNN